MAAEAVPPMTLGVRLYMARKTAKLDQQDIADGLRAAGYKTSRALVSMWERGEGKEPTTSQVRVIAELTGSSYAWLVGVPLRLDEGRLDVNALGGDALSRCIAA